MARNKINPKLSYKRQHPSWPRLKKVWASLKTKFDSEENDKLATYKEERR